MDARDAIVSWLEQSNNFLRVTALSPFSPSTSRGNCLRDVVQTESQALSELATFVNKSVLSANWDAKHVKQMLKHYLWEYRATADAAANPMFSVDEMDKLRGVKSVDEKLNRMCQNFVRLQHLHDPLAMMTKRGRKNTRNDSGGYKKLQFSFSDAQRSARENDIVPESDFSNSCENSETVTRNEEGKENSQNAKNATTKKCRVVPVRRSTRTKRQKVSSLDKKLQVPKSYEEVAEAKKFQHMKTSKGNEEIADITPTQTTQTDSASSQEERVASEASRRRRTKVAVSSKKHISAALTKELQHVKSSKNNAGVTPTKMVQSTGVSSQDDKVPSEGRTKVASPPKKRISATPTQTTESGSKSSREKVVSPPKKSTSARKSSVQGPLPESLRSAIARVVSQRQQLLLRQHSRNESDSEVSDSEIRSDTPEPRVYNIFDDKPNLARKRAYFRAKELAFEQLKWQSENELQQLECNLLHREMEAREAVVQQEFKIQQMRIRADVIQTMIRNGANIANIAEQLKLLNDV